MKLSNYKPCAVQWMDPIFSVSFSFSQDKSTNARSSFWKWWCEATIQLPVGTWEGQQATFRRLNNLITETKSCQCALTLNNVLRRYANRIDHTLKNNCHWRKDDGRERSRKNKNIALDGLRNRRTYWELKEEAEDRNRWKRFFKSLIFYKRSHNGSL